MIAHTLKVGAPGNKYPAFASEHISRGDVHHLRWLYRSLRREGVRASSARMYVTCSYLVGCGAGHAVGMHGARLKEQAA